MGSRLIRMTGISLSERQTERPGPHTHTNTHAWTHIKLERAKGGDREDERKKGTEGQRPNT